MRIAVVGDVHGRVLHALAGVLATQRRHGVFDAIFQVGDFGAYADRDAVVAGEETRTLEPSAYEFLGVCSEQPAWRTQVARVRRQLPGPIFFIRGNHEDHRLLERCTRDAPGTSAAVDPCDIARVVRDGSILHAGGMRIACLGGVEVDENPSALLDDTAYRELWQRGPGAVDVLLTHDPPAGVYTSPSGEPRGSPMVAALTRRLQPRVHIAGHLHVAVGPQMIDDTVFFGLAAVLRSPTFDPSRSVRDECIAVVSDDPWSVTPLRGDWLTSITARTLHTQLGWDPYGDGP